MSIPHFVAQAYGFVDEAEKLGMQGHHLRRGRAQERRQAGLPDGRPDRQQGRRHLPGARHQCDRHGADRSRGRGGHSGHQRQHHERQSQGARAHPLGRLRDGPAAGRVHGQDAQGHRQRRDAVRRQRQQRLDLPRQGLPRLCGEAPGHQDPLRAMDPERDRSRYQGDGRLEPDVPEDRRRLQRRRPARDRRCAGVARRKARSRAK